MYHGFSFTLRILGILMANHSLLCGCISVTMRLSSVNNLPHFLLILLRQLNITRSPVLLQTTGLSGARNGDQSLRSNPSECDLTDLATLASSKLFNFFHNCAILVEVLALEFRDFAAEVIGCEVVGGVVVKVIDEPAVSQWAVGDVGHAQFFGCIDQAVRLVQCLEG